MSASPREQPMSQLTITDAFYQFISLQMGAISNMSVALTQLNKIADYILTNIDEQKQQQTPDIQSEPKTD